MEQHDLAMLWEFYKDDDEFLQQVHDALLKIVPKVTTTKDENGEVMLHLIDCPHVRSQTKYDAPGEIKVKSCTCILEYQAAKANRRNQQYQ
jgi:hypothetical protein